jgi:putative ABC transport system substrate-binding protein
MIHVGRREFITLLGGAAAAWPVAAHPQDRGQVRKVGVLVTFAETDPEGQASVGLFRQVLNESGWIEGENVKLFVHWITPSDDIVEHARAIVSLSPDVILAGTTRALLPLLEETHRIAIVFVGVSDPLSQGIVTSLARPGGNVTGFSNPAFSLVSKSLQMLKEIAPTVVRVAVIISAVNGSAPMYFRVIDEIAKPLAITPIKATFQTRAEIKEVVEAFAAEPNGALFVPRDTTSESNRDLLIELAARHRLPAIYGRRSFVADGGLVSYGSDPMDQYRTAASYVARILHGEKPGELPIQEPTKFELALNLKTAKALGLTVPLPLQAAADEVIE